VRLTVRNKLEVNRAVVIAVKVEEQVSAPEVVIIKETKRETKKETCVHHWVIEEAKEPTSKGECKKCHEVKEFNNYVESRSEWAKSPKPFTQKQGR